MYVNSALLMISSTSKNTVCSSSEQLQKTKTKKTKKTPQKTKQQEQKVIAKKGGARPESAYDIPRLIIFCTIKNISISRKRFNFTIFFFK